MTNNGLSTEDWRKLLYVHAVRVTQARTSEEKKEAVSAALAVEKLAKLVGVSTSSDDPTDGPDVDVSARSPNVRRALAPETDLRDDQILPMDDSSE